MKGVTAVIQVACLGTAERLQNSELEAIIKDLSKDQYKIQFFEIPKAQELPGLLLQLKQQNFDRILVGGGDGTLHRVVQAVTQLSPADQLPIGILPLGTANDFSITAGYGQDGLQSALMKSLVGKVRHVDLGWCNGTSFVNAASGGFVTKSTTEVSGDLKKKWGPLAYYWKAISQAKDVTPFELTCSFEQETFRESCLAFVVGNSSTAGGGARVAPEAVLNDGYLDLLIIQNQSFLSLANLALELFKDSPNLDGLPVRYRQLSRFEIETSEEIQLNLDGEPQTGRSFHFWIQPRSLKMVVSTDLLE